MIELLTLGQDATPWFDNPGMVGGLLGAGVGVFGGGIYGPLAGILAPRGKARGLVLGYHFFLLAMGIVLLGVALYAMFTGQPYAVWYSLALPGFLLTLLFSIFTPVILGRYRVADHRRLNAEEFRRAPAGATGDDAGGTP